MENPTLTEIVERTIQLDYPLQRALACEQLAIEFKKLASEYFLEDDLDKATSLKTAALLVLEQSRKYRAEFNKSKEERDLLWSQMTDIEQFLSKIKQD